MNKQRSLIQDLLKHQKISPAPPPLDQTSPQNNFMVMEPHCVQLHMRVKTLKTLYHRLKRIFFGIKYSFRKVRVKCINYLYILL